MIIYFNAQMWAVGILLTCPHVLALSTSLPSFFFKHYCPNLGMSHFSKDPQFFFVEKGVQKQRSSCWHCSLLLACHCFCVCSLGLTYTYNLQLNINTHGVSECNLTQLRSSFFPYLKLPLTMVRRLAPIILNIFTHLLKPTIYRRQFQNLLPVSLEKQTY